MPKSTRWFGRNDSPEWIMDRDGKLLGYRDERGGEHLIPTFPTEVSDDSSTEDAAGVVFGSAWDRTQVVMKTVGDSRFAAYVGVAGTANSVATLAIGDLTNTNAGPQNIAKYLGGGAIKTQNFAVIGTRTTALNGQLDQALASGDPAKEIVSILTSTNDRSAAPLVPIGTQLASVRAAVARIRRTGRRVLLCLEPPQRGSYWAAGVPEQHAQMVALQRELASLDPGVRLADFLTPVIDATGSVYAAGTRLDPYYDVVHEKLTGGLLWGRAMINGMGDWITPNRVQTGLAAASANNSVTNTALDGTGGVGGGTPGIIGGGTSPTGWMCGRSLSNSWDKSIAFADVINVRASSAVYAIGDRMSVPGIDAVDFVCSAVTADATTAASVPTMNTSLLATTTDGNVTWLAYPRFNAFDGRRGVMIYGAGTADNTRCTFHQDISMSAANYAVGDTIRGSMFHAALGQWAAFQLEVQAMTGTNKITSSFDQTAAYINTAALEPSIHGKLFSPDYVIPAGADTIRLRFHGISRNGFSCAHIMVKPELEKA